MKKVFYGWWIVLACFFISLYVGGIVYYSFTAFFEPLIKEFGWSYAQISFAMSLRGMEMGIFSPFIGFLVDRFGSRKIISCGTVLVGFGLILLSLTRSLAMFYGSFLLITLGAGGCMSLVVMTAVGNWFSKNVGKALGIVACGTGIGGLTIPLVVWLINLYGWRTTLIILGLGMWILGIPLSLVVRGKPEKYGCFPDGDSRQDSMLHLKNRGKGVEISFKEAVKQRAFLYLMLAEGIRSMAHFAVFTHVMPYLSSMGIPRSTAGMVAAAIPLFSIVGRVGFGWLGDIYEKRYVMAMTLCLTSMGMLAFCYVQERWVILIFLLTFPPGFGGGMVVGRTILREYFGKDSFGKMLGIIMGSGAIGGIIGPTLAGWVFDTQGSYHFIWLFLCGFIGIAIWLILRIKKPLIKIYE